MNESKYKIGDRIILRYTPPEEAFDTIVDEIIGLWHEGDRVKYQIIDPFDILMAGAWNLKYLRSTQLEAIQRLTTRPCGGFFIGTVVPRELLEKVFHAKPHLCFCIVL